MKLLSVAHAKSVWICHVTDLNPKGRYLIQEILPFLLETYKFKKYPLANIPMSEVKDLSFEDGEYINEEGELINVKFSLKDYGFEAESRSSTKDMDNFLEKILTQLHENFNVVHHGDFIRDREYVSQLNINTDISLDIINPKLRTVSEYLSNNLEGFNKTNFEIGGLFFWADQTEKINPLPFSLERTIGSPFEENRYLSTSSLQTDKHIEAIELLEKVLSE